MKNSRKFESINIIRRADLDFTDDGTRFRGYEYRGVPITYTKACDTMYFSVRPDYLTDLAYSDYCNEYWYKYCDAFNGVDEIEEKYLIPFLEAIVKGIAEVRERVNNDTPDFTAFEERKIIEVKMIENKIDEIRNNFNWVDAEMWQINEVRSAIKNLKEYKNRLENMASANVPVMRSRLHNFNTYGYVLVKEDNSFIEIINKYLTK